MDMLDGLIEVLLKRGLVLTYNSRGQHYYNIVSARTPDNYNIDKQRGEGASTYIWRLIELSTQYKDINNYQENSDA